MSSVYFFKNDGTCEVMKKQFTEYFPKYLHEPVEFNGKMVKFYLILNWLKTEINGPNVEVMNAAKVNYVETVNDLPEGAGVYTAGYDADIVEYEELKRKGVPIIDHSCPWVVNLKKQLQAANFETHQGVIMLLKGHVVEKCYKSLFPDDLIMVDHYNFEEQLKKYKNDKPIHLFVYACFSPRVVAKLINHINATYPHQENILDGYNNTLCGYIMHQGVIEEIGDSIKKHNINEMWIIGSGTGDTSTRTLIYEANELGVGYRLIRGIEDIPESVGKDLNVGVMEAPISIHGNVNDIKEAIRSRFDRVV